MATTTGAFGVKPGFNQSGQGYYMVIETGLWAKLSVPAGSTGSGGAYAVSALTLAQAEAVTANGAAVSTFFNQGRLVRDCGKTIVSAGRAFRKIQAVVGEGQAASTFGVSGPVGGTLSTPDTGYATYYVEVATNGGPAPSAANLGGIARYA
jgi:hypothetical protein